MTAERFAQRVTCNHVVRTAWLLSALLFMGIHSALAATTEVIDLQLRWHHQFQFAGYYAAVEKGFYREEGLEVRLHVGDSAHQPVAEVLAGRAQYAEANSEVLFHRLQGKPLIALAAIFQHSPSVLLARADSGIHSAQGLIGKRVMMQGGTADVDFLTMLRGEGIALSQVNIIPSSYNIDDLINGKTDAFNSYSTNEPFYLKQHHIAYNVIDPGNYRVDFYSDILFTTEAELTAHPRRVEAMRRATLKGWRYAMDHPEEIINLLINQYHVTKTRDHLEFEAAEMRKLILPDLIEIGHINPGRMQHMTDALVSTGLVRTGAKLEGFIYSTTPKPWPAWVVPALVTSLCIIMLSMLMVSHLLRLQTALRQSRRHLQAVIDNTPVCVKQVAGDGSLLAMNQAGLGMIRAKNADAVLGKNVYNLVSPEFRERYKLFNERVCAGEAGSMTFEMIDMEGNRHWMETHAVPFISPTSSVASQLAVTQDVSIQKQAEAALIAAKEVAEATALAKSAFLANMSHEIRTPMNAILGFSHLGLDETDIAVQQAYMNNIHQSAAGLLEIINGILDFSKIGANKMTLETAPFRLHELLGETRQTLLLAADEKHLQFSCHISSDVPDCLQGDSLRLRQVLTNLIANAIKFTEHGRVTVNVELASRLGHQVMIRFSVTDTGIGMTADQQKRLFQAFFQADSSTTRKYGGTGLGLAISQQLVHLMGGEISVISEINHGSIFTFTVSLQESLSPIPIHSEVSDVSAKTLSGMHVLLVEDNKVNQVVAQTLLKKVGAEVTLANHGKEALDLLKMHTFDAVLMDVQMPEMNGYEAAVAIRSELKLTELPIIALTAHAMLDERESCLDSGMNDVMTKPIQPQVLYEALARYANHLAHTE